MFHVKRKRVAFRCPAGACLFCRLLPLPLVCFFAPIPPAPLPGGKGETKVILCKGLRPLHPRHQTACGTYRPCRTGARRLNPGGVTRREPLSFGFEANHGFNPGDARGGSPLHKKTKILPLPAGKGAGGMGERNKAKGRTSRRQGRQAAPGGFRNGKVGRQPESPSSTGRVARPLLQCRPGSAPGMQGAQPLA